MSLNVGAIRYTEQTLISDPVTQEELDQTVTAIEEDLTALQFDGTIDTLVGIGGVITNLSAVKYQGAAIIRAVMRKASVDSLTVSDRGLRHGLMFDRFDC